VLISMQMCALVEIGMAWGGIPIHRSDLGQESQQRREVPFVDDFILIPIYVDTNLS